MALFYFVENTQVVLINAASSPGAGWVSVASLQAAINQARTSNLPLFLRPGVYTTGAVTVSAGTGGGNPLTLRATPGTATIRLNAAGTHLLLVDSVPNVSLEGVVFDGDNRALSGALPQGVIRFTGLNASNFSVRNCRVLNSTQSGIAVANQARGRILENMVSNCKTGIFVLDGISMIENNTLEDLKDNGIAVWTSAINGNGSQVVGNHINIVGNVSGGTGEYGNGILVFQAVGVKVSGNTIYNVKYSSIRANAAPDCQIIGNNCWNAREVAIFIEAPGAGFNLTGCVVSDNVVKMAGMGISVANAGLYGDGFAKRCVVSNNVISEITVNPIPDAGYTPPQTTGMGIGVEISSNVVGNIIEGTQGAGIHLGTNNAASNLAATGNVIIDAPMGIGYSADSAARAILISSNLIRGYRNITSISNSNYPVSGAIVSQSFNGTTYFRDTAGSSPNTDYGNTAHTAVGSLTVGMNQASV